MRERFDDPRSKNKRLNANTHQTIEQANSILVKYKKLGYTVTLRQLYYQLVARNLIPNTDNSYKRLSEVLGRGRLMGLVDWDAIEDRVRYIRTFGQFESSQNFMDQAANYYSEFVWRDQPNYIEVWPEKDAVSNIVARVCEKWRVPYVSLRGFNSLSEMYLAGKRIEEQCDLDKKVTIIHIGDHDPSGQDMTRDNEARLQMFSRGCSFDFHRLALNMDQIREYKPPPNPAKSADSRYAAYVRQYGTDCWELDALDPAVLDSLLNDAIEPLVDKELFDVAIEIEDGEKEKLRSVAANWPNALEASTDNGEYAW